MRTRRWYDNHADETWGNEKPTVQETRVHAKCLRSVESVRDYFRDYRAKKKGDKHVRERLLLLASRPLSSFLSTARLHIWIRVVAYIRAVLRMSCCRPAPACISCP